MHRKFNLFIEKRNIKSISRSTVILALSAALIFAGCSQMQAGSESSSKGTSPTESAVIESVSTEHASEEASSKTLPEADSLKKYFPEISSSFFDIIADKADHEFSGYSVMNSVFFTVISSQSLENVTPEVTFDTPIICTAAFSMDSTEYLLPENVLDAYYHEKAKNESDEELSDTDLHVLYEQLDNSDLPHLYIGTLVVTFPQAQKYTDVVLHEMYVKMNGVEYKFPLDKICFDQELCPTVSSGKLISEMMALSDLNVSENAVKLQNLRFTAEEDLQITSVSLMNDEETVISQIQVKDDAGFDYLWDQSAALSMEDGQTLDLTITLQNQKFSLDSNFRRILLIHYSTNSGDYSEYIEITIRGRDNPFVMYAVLEDGMDQSLLNGGNDL